MIALLLAAGVDDDLGAILAVVHDLERPVLAIFSNLRETSTYQPFCIINRIRCISGGLVESCRANYDLVLGLEGDDRRRRIYALVILQNIDAAIYPQANARLSRAQINAYPRFALV